MNSRSKCPKLTQEQQHLLPNTNCNQKNKLLKSPGPKASSSHKEIVQMLKVKSIVVEYRQESTSLFKA